MTNSKFIFFIFVIISVVSTSSSFLKYKNKDCKKSKNTSKITCVGNSQKSVQNNQVRIGFQISTKGLVASDALLDNNKISNSVISAITQLGVPMENINTINISVTPLFKIVNNESIPDGFLALNSIEVKLTDLLKVGQIIDEGVKAGALINYVIYGVSDDIKSQAKKDLIGDAVLDCKFQSQVALKAIGYVIDEFIEINLQDSDIQIFTNSIKSFVEISSTPVLPGQTTIKIKVNAILTFEKESI